MQRRQLLDPDDATRGPALTRSGQTPFVNEVELVALLSAPGRISVTSGGRTEARDVGAGLQTVRVAAAPGRPSASLARDGQIVLAKTSDWPIDPAPARHDATYGGGSTTRPIIRVP